MEVSGWTVHHPLYTEKKVVDNVSFNVRRGEIVGFSGLQGAGRTELAMSIFGRSYGSGISGKIKIDGEEKELRNVRDAIKAGLAYVTEDRKGNGLILEESIAKNITMSRLEKVCGKGIINIDKENAVAEEYKQKLRTKTPSVQQAVGNLSGGNQQKVLLSKWMFADPEVLILDEPTRGIDVGAKYEIYCIMNDLVAQGKSVVMISSEMPELLGMCDRIYVMNEGKMVAEMPASEATQEKIMAAILQSDKK
jgi:putative multiple sugar transport system ATP-binding protein